MAVGVILAAGLVYPPEASSRHQGSGAAVISAPASAQPWKTAQFKPPKVVPAAVKKPKRKLTVVGRQGLTPAAQRALEFVNLNFPEVTLVGGVRPDPIPDHPSGRALDIMVPNLAVGDAVFRVLSDNKKRLGVRYMLWRKPQHFDHIHLCVY